MKFIFPFLFWGSFFLITACASVEEVDRSYVNLPQMDVRSNNNLGQPSPKSGLRNWASQTGQATCSVCSH